jgi:hypothetical protein
VHDPVRALWDELERADCDPHGPEHAFRARCPAHQGENREALVVKEGAGGIALVTCWAHHCTARQIVAALGRPEAWLFPDYTPEPIRGRRRTRSGRRLTALDAALGLLSLAGVNVERAAGPLPYRDGCGMEPGAFYVGESCPACGVPGLWVSEVSAREVVMACWSGCEQDRIREAARDRALSRA